MKIYNALPLSAAVLVFTSAFCLVPQTTQAALYAPGATLDPACAPTDSNCGIVGTASLSDIVPGYGIAAWGDSLTAGITTGGATSTGVASSYPSRLAALTGYYIYNGGIPGENSSNLLTLMQGDTQRQHMPAVIWIGYNDIHSAGLTNSQIEANIASMVSLIGTSNYIVLGVINNNTGSNDWTGGANYNTIVALNADLASIYGSHYIDIRAHLISLYNPSLPQDVTDYGHDTLPTSLRASDNVHLNSAGYDAVAAKINTQLSVLTSGLTQPKTATALNLSYLFSSPGIIGESNPNAGYFTTLNASSSIAVGGVTLLKIGGSNFSDIILGKGADTNLFTASAVHNVAIGQGVLSAATSSSFNTGIGSLALQSDTSGASNVAVGYSALNANTSGGSNVGVGYSALNTNSTGSFNTAVGDWSLWFNSSATNTTAVGYRAGYGGSTYNNQGGVYLGYFSGRAVQTGSDYNTFLGYQSGNEVSTGSGNILIGPEVNTGGNHLTTGQGNIGIGYNIIFPGGTNAANQLNIGNVIFGTGITATSSSNSIPGTLTGNIGIGTSTPNATLEISGLQASTGLTAFTNGVTTAITNRSTTNNTFSRLAFRSQDVTNGFASSTAEIVGIGTSHTANTISGALAFLTNNAGNLREAGRFTAVGNLGIGTTSPATTLEVGGDITVDNVLNCATLKTDTNGKLNCVSSDERLKRDITPLDPGDSLAAIEKLRPVSFYWKDPTNGPEEQLGFIAQEVQQIFPELVATGSPTALTPGGTRTFNYLGLISPVVKAIQEVAKQVQGMTTSITTQVIHAVTGHFDNLCVKKSNGSDICITGDQLQQVLQNGNQQATPPPVPGAGAESSIPLNSGTTTDATTTDSSDTTNPVDAAPGTDSGTTTDSSVQ